MIKLLYALVSKIMIRLKNELAEILRLIVRIRFENCGITKILHLRISENTERS